MEELMAQTKSTISNFSKSVAKLNLYSDRLILEADKGCVVTNTLRPADEKLVVETTKAAIKLILEYDSYLQTVQEVEAKKKVLPKVDPQEYNTKTKQTLETIKTDLVKLKLFQDYSEKLKESLAAGNEEEAGESSVMSANNSYSFS